MLFLFFSIALLFIAPALHAVSSKKDIVFCYLNGFVFVLIAALIGLEILPRLLDANGPIVLLILLCGFLLPTLTEKALHQTKIVHKAAVFIAILGLSIHTLVDGAALALEGSDQELALGVVLHRVPVGLFVWWFIKPHFGKFVAFSMLSIIASGTLIGFSWAEVIMPSLESKLLIYFQAFVVGTLIHVLLHRPPASHTNTLTPQASRRGEGMGNLLGILCACYLLMHSDHQPQINWLAEAGYTFIYLALETAPMLLIAFIFAGLIKAFMPDTFVNWLSSGSTLKKATKGMAIGIPLPLCSCSVVPVYHSLIKKHVPKSAAIAFLIATPELGIDALLISLPLLGVEMTITRLIAAAILAMAVALIVAKFTSKKSIDNHSHEHSHHNHEHHGHEHSHHNHEHEHHSSVSWQEKLKNGMHYSTHDLLDHLAPWILVGLLLAAIMQPFLSNLDLASIPAGVQVLLFALLGIPVYVCASSATPLVAIFLMNGVSPGAGLAFLLAGPATNVTTFGILAKLHDKKTAIVLGVSCFVTAVLLGIVANFALSNFVPIDLAVNTQELGSLYWTALIIFVGLIAYSIYRNGLRAFILQLIPHQHSDEEDCTHNHCNHSH